MRTFDRVDPASNLIFLFHISLLGYLHGGSEEDINLPEEIRPA